MPETTDPATEAIHQLERLSLVRDFYLASMEAGKAQGESKAKNKAERKAAEKLLTAFLGRKPTPEELDETLRC